MAKLQALAYEDRCWANMAQIRQSRPISGLGFQAKALRRLQNARSNMAHIGQSKPDSGPGFQNKVLQTL